MEGVQNYALFSRGKKIVLIKNVKFVKPDKQMSYSNSEILIYRAIIERFQNSNGEFVFLVSKQRHLIPHTTFWKFHPNPHNLGPKIEIFEQLMRTIK